MCVIDKDTGKVFKKFDVYYVDLGTSIDDAKGDIIKERPCVIMSDNNVDHSRYLVVPIRTEHSTNVTTAEKAEKIVEENKKKGRLNVPIRMEESLYRFAEITQMRSVAIQRITNYYTTITNPAVQQRLEDELKNFLFGDTVIKLTPYSRNTDIRTIVKKFDIWNCMTGKEIQGKYVVLRANRMSESQYITVAPIYNEAPRGVYDDELDEYLNNKRKEGVICVPIKYSSTSNEYSFINMSKINSITNSQLKRFECSIINESVRRDINNKIIELLLDDEDVEISTVVPENIKRVIEEPIELVIEEPTSVQELIAHEIDKPVDEVQIIESEPAKPKAKGRPKNKNTYPDKWETVYEEYIGSTLTAKEASELLEISIYKFRDLLKTYRKDLKAQGKEIKFKVVKEVVAPPPVKVKSVIVETPKKEDNIKPKLSIPNGFGLRYKQFQNGKITRKDFAESFGITNDELTSYIKDYERLRDPMM